MDSIKEPREDRRKEPIPGEYGLPVPKELFYRELGFGGFSSYHNFPRHNTGKKLLSQNLATKAVHTLCTKEQLSRRKFNLPNGARTTFHIAFSPDGTKVASCHGDHNVYVCDIASGEVLQTLAGHPRTPWCVVFHPTQNDVLASGCLAGHVRVWDLKGGSELLVTDSGTVIASLAFHPSVRLLAIATFNEIIFWDWGHPYPMARCSTENTKEKVRLVRFDRLGRSLITGITNFPTPPNREEVRRPVRGGGSFRPNILSRAFRGSRRFSPTYSRSAAAQEENVDDMESDDVVVEGVILPNPEIAAEAAAHYAMGGIPGVDDESPIVGETLSARQDRFQESYRQLVSHYEELVSNYQQFLRSRIPRILEGAPLPSMNDSALATDSLAPALEIINNEVEVSQMEESFETEPLSSASTSTIAVPEPDNDSSDGPITTLEPPASPVVMDDEVPGPSRLLFEANQEPINESVEEQQVSSNSNGSDEPMPSSSSTAGSSSSTAGNGNGVRSETDLRSIEALAQNILEMQNLCSQVRMDAPLAVENQHIVELRVIRRHLELLQEQTRDLQSSIRATLNSLATGSLAALRSHVGNASAPLESMGPVHFLNLEQATPPAPIESTPPSFNFETHPPPPLSPPATMSSRTPSTPITPVSPNLDTPPALRNDAPPSTPRPSPSPFGDGSVRVISTNHINGPGLYHFTIPGPSPSEVRPVNAPLFNRIRVPPVVTMQYEVREHFPSSYAQAVSRNTNETTTTPSATAREGGNNNGNGNGRRREAVSPNPPPRRVVREFHVVSNRPGTFIAEEHARHCPFSGRDPYHWRPPPRMRSLHDMGEMPSLVTWPTMDTGMETSIRNFREVTPPLASSSRVIRPFRPNITITVRNGLGVPLNLNAHNEPSPSNSSRNEPFMSFSEWLFLSGISFGNLTNDVFVGIYLTVRQRMELTFGGNTDSDEFQQLLRTTVLNLTMIPPNLRLIRPPPTPVQSQRQSRRRRPHALTNPESDNNCPFAREDQISITTRYQNFIRSSSCTGSGSTGAGTNNNPRSRDESPSTSSASKSSNSSASATATSSSERPVPNQIDRNFSRVFYIRAADELIPVYSTVNSTETVLGTEVRESLQVNVYYLPIGLFLQGGPWETGTQTIGIHWPPVTREEEYAILDLRMSDRPLTIHQSDTRESLSNNNRRYPRIRLDYDQTSLRVHLPTGFSLHFIQSGLTLLDCISTSLNLPRPRPLEGSLYIDYLGPFLDALERMFGLRHSRRSVGPISTGPRIGAYLGRTPPWVIAGGAGYRAPTFQPNGGGPAADRDRPSTSNNNPGNGGAIGSNNGNSNSNNSNNNNSNPTSGSSGRDRDRPLLYSSRRVGSDSAERGDRPRRIITQANDAPVGGDTSERRRRFLEDHNLIMSHGYMYENNSGDGFRSFLERNAQPRRVYHFRQRHNYRHDLLNSPNISEVPTSDGGSGRFIRLAVDTAASEVLRRNQESQNGLPVVEAGSAGGFSSIGRPVESRIERVLNERGNRGAHSPSPPGTGLDDPGRHNRMRLEDIQMRISMLSQWSRARAMATSGTQTRETFGRQWPGLLNPSASTSTSSNAQSQSSQSTPSPTQQPERGASVASALRRRRQIATAISTSTNSNSSNSSNSNSTATSELRITRRRPYSRIARMAQNDADGDSEEEIILSVPARLPRLTDQNGGAEYRGRAFIRERSEAAGSSRESSGRTRPNLEWVLRPVPPSQRNRPPSVLEISGSARTRATPLNNRSNPSEAAETNGAAADPRSQGEQQPLPPRPRVGRTGRGRTPATIGIASSTNANDGNNNSVGNNGGGGGGDDQNVDAGARFYPGYIPEILITPRTRAPTYYTMDAATTAFLSSRIQKWDFSEFLIPDITKRDEFVVVRECSLHSDACLDVSSDAEFLAVLQPSDSGSYSSVGLYSLRDDSLGEELYVFHFDQNTVSVSIAPSCDYLVVGYAGRGPLYRFVHPSRNIGKILSLTRDDEEGFKLVSVKDLYADGQVAFMSINCMHWVPVAGYGIIYGTNTGDLVLLY